MSGLLDKEVAERTGLSTYTVRTYWRRIRTKLGGGSRAEVLKHIAQTVSERELRSKATENEVLLAEMAKRRQTEEALAAQHAMFMAVLSQMPSGVVVAEAPSGRIVLSNRQMERIFRQPTPPAESIEDYRTWQGFHPDGRSYAPDEWPLARSILEGETVENEEIQVMRGDGARGVVSASSTPIHDREGKLIGAVVVVFDMTQRHEDARLLRIYRSDFEETCLGIAIDDGRAITQVNSTFARIHGYAPEELIGKPISILFTEEERDAFPAVLDLVKERGCALLREEHLRKDGSRFPVFKHVRVVEREDGAVDYRIFNVFDASEAVSWRDLSADQIG